MEEPVQEEAAWLGWFGEVAFFGGIVIGTGLAGYRVYKKLAKIDYENERTLRKDLAVPAIYEYDPQGYHKTAMNAYYDLLEEHEARFCKEHAISASQPVPKDWMQKAGPEAMSSLKMALLEWAMVWVHFYRLVEEERTRANPLWKAGLMSDKYFYSVRQGDTELNDAFIAIKDEAAIMVPGQDPMTLVKEACQIVDRYNFLPETGMEAVQERMAREATNARAKAAQQQQQQQAAARAAPSAAPTPQQQPPPNVRQVPTYAEPNGLYNLKQNGDELEVKVWVPVGTQSKDVAVTIAHNSLSVVLKSQEKVLLDTEFLPQLEVDTDGSTWTIHNSPEFEIGDPVELHSLNTASLNGKKGLVEKPNRDSLEKSRIRIAIEKKKNEVLSIQPKNLRNKNTKKCCVHLHLEKKIKDRAWRLPPFAQGQAS